MQAEIHLHSPPLCMPFCVGTRRQLGCGNRLLSCMVVTGLFGCVPSQRFRARLGSRTGLALTDLFGYQNHRILT